VLNRLRANGKGCRLRKVECQLRRAYAYAGAKTRFESATANASALSTWPDPDRKLINQIVTSGPSLHDLWESSPVRFEDGQPHTEDFIDALFPGNPLLCIGESSSRFLTAERESFRGVLRELQFIVPSPMTALLGHTKEGRESAHTLENTGPRWFLVVECDFEEFDSSGKETEWAPLIREWRTQGISVADACAAILNYLAHRGPLVMVVDSGGKSLHGWFYCAGVPDNVLRRFMNCAHRLGADKATWLNRSQFVRMPDGTRSNGNRQSVYYFNPEPVK
jgi:hypothetical protein